MGHNAQRLPCHEQARPPVLDSLQMALHDRPRFRTETKGTGVTGKDGFSAQGRRIVTQLRMSRERADLAENSLPAGTTAAKGSGREYVDVRA